MEPKLPFTTEQSFVISHSGSIFVDACPGAGKTQAVIQRFIERPGISDRRGIALLSFTNAAAQELMDRCTTNPDLIDSPNFVGTIDRFVSAFIVGPSFHRRYGNWPSIVDSWDGVQGANFRVAGCNLEFSLEWFGIDSRGNRKLVPRRVPRALRQALKSVTDGDLARARQEATRLQESFYSNGVLNCDRARQDMRKLLANSIESSKVRASISSRFFEIVVDEVQDCATSDVDLIDFLISSELRVVLVGDLEQKIFSFRDDEEVDLDRVLTRIPKGPRLNTNFRSSPTICKAVSSMRHGPESDQSSWNESRQDTPIQIIIAPEAGQVRSAVLELLNARNHCPEDVVMLAYSNAAVAELAGSAIQSEVQPGPLASVRSVCLAVSAGVLSRRDLEKTTTQFVGAIRSLSSPRLYSLSEESFCAEINMSQREFRETCIRIEFGLGADHNGWAHLRNDVIRLLIEAGWIAWTDVGKLFVPSGAQWHSQPSLPTPRVRCSTIHSFKGLQSPAIALQLPALLQGESTGIDDWSDEIAHERRRVLYVGMSRAQQLLILVTPPSTAAIVQRNLSKFRVTFDPPIDLR